MILWDYHILDEFWYDVFVTIHFPEEGVVFQDLHLEQNGSPFISKAAPNLSGTCPLDGCTESPKDCNTVTDAQ